METQFKKLLLLLGLIFFSCNSSSIQDKSLFEYTKKWRDDKSGCMNLRNKSYSDSINSKIDFNNFYERDIIKYLGDYDNKVETTDYRYLNYFYNSRCSKEVVIDSVEKCYLQYQVDIKTKKIIKHLNICE
jgi:hypothetical protein